MATVRLHCCWLLSGGCCCCCTGTWHGKRVACKIMQLPASGPFGSQEERAPAALMAQNQANSPPHMAIMEAVLSSTVSHPNVSRHSIAQHPSSCCAQSCCILLHSWAASAFLSWTSSFSSMCLVLLQVVQVYTYMVNPLGVADHGDNDGHHAAEAPLPLPSAAADAGSPQAPWARQPHSKITGWELKLVMEYCNAVRGDFLIGGQLPWWCAPGIETRIAAETTAWPVVPFESTAGDWCAVTRTVCTLLWRVLQGTLREALDRRVLHGEGVKYLPREDMLLCHDIAAALMHLHSQGGSKEALGAGTLDHVWLRVATCGLVCSFCWSEVPSHPPQQLCAGLVLL